jgi:hypothetical protein
METRARLRDSDFMGEVVSILCPVWLLPSRLLTLTPRVPILPNPAHNTIFPHHLQDLDGVDGWVWRGTQEVNVHKIILSNICWVRAASSPGLLSTRDPTGI